MPAFSAAVGSFHVKSASTYFVMVFITVRVLPFFLTVVLICSDTLLVSTLSVRSYTDQRYSSMQVSATQSLRISTARSAGYGYSFPGSDKKTDASCTRVSGGFASAMGASAMAASGRSSWEVGTAVAGIASTIVASAVKDSPSSAAR